MSEAHFPGEKTSFLAISRCIPKNSEEITSLSRSTSKDSIRGRIVPSQVVENLSFGSCPKISLRSLQESSSIRDVSIKFTGPSSAVTIALPWPAVFSSTKPKSNPKPSLVMKPIIPFALLGALLAVGAADAAATDPVGYITINVVANGETYISPTLVEADTFAGSSTVSPSGGAVITFASGVPTGLDGSYVLEIGANGWWATVVSSTTTTITVNSPFPAGLPANTQVSVRKHSTLATFMGENAPGLITFDGINPSDEVQVLDAAGIPQQVTSFGYIAAIDLGDPLYPNGAWFNLGTSAVDNNFIIEPGSAIRIKRVGGTPLTFTVDGEVKTTPTQVDLYTNFNWVGTPLATGGTLDGMTFNTQLIQFDGISPNYDELQFLRPNQTAVPFASVLDGVTPTSASMFNLADSVFAPTEPFPEGTGVVINRIGNAASTITLPGTVVTP